MSQSVTRCDDADESAPVLRFDAGALGKLSRTPTGGVRVPARVTRSGVFPYKRADGSTVLEYRPADEVFAASSLASLADCAVTIAHPASGRVTTDSFKRDSVGYVRDGGQREGQFVSAQLVVQDGGAIAKIDAGELVELSCGYACRLDMTPGTTPDGERYDAVQRGISYNHVALLAKGGGRAGRDVALRLDNAAVAIDDDAPKTTDNEPDRATRTDSMKTERIDGVDYTIGSPEWAQARAKQQAADAAKLSDLTTKLDTAEKAVTAAKAELDGAKAALAAQAAELVAAKDETKLDAKIAERATLIEQAKRVLGAGVKLDGKTADAIRREVCTKLDGAACVEGKDEAFVAAFFSGRIASLAALQLAAPRTDALPAAGEKPDHKRYLVRPGDV